MSDDLVRRARDALDGVTDAPWHAANMQGPRRQTNFARVFAADDDLRFIADCRDTLNFHSLTDNEKNAHFIAASRDLVPVMADRIELLEAQLAQCDAALKAADELSNALGAYNRAGAGPLTGWQDVQDALAAYRTARGQDAD